MLVPTRPFLAAQGGRGFTGEGWETNTDYDLIGDPRAVKGGVLRQAMMTDFPATFQFYGPNISEWNLSLYEMVYEGLLYLHPTTLQDIPGLPPLADIRRPPHIPVPYQPQCALVRRYARRCGRRRGRLAALGGQVAAGPGEEPDLQQLEPPVAESKYIVSVRAKTEDWQNFMHRLRSAHRRDVHPAGARPERRDR